MYRIFWGEAGNGVWETNGNCIAYAHPSINVAVNPKNHQVGLAFSTVTSSGFAPGTMKALLFFFWRDHSGHEIDLIIEDGPVIKAVEIKSGSTLPPTFFEGLSWFARQTGLSPSQCVLVHGGESRQSRKAGEVRPWNDAVI